MRHHQSIRKLGRERGQRRALLKTLAGSLIRHGRIKTTEAKAKELRPWVERLTTKARAGGLASERAVIAALGNEQAAWKLIRDIAPKMKGRAGGYTRIIKVSGVNRADSAPEAIIEFV